MIGRARIGWQVVTKQIQRAPHYSGALFHVLAFVLAIAAQLLLQRDDYWEASLLFMGAVVAFWRQQRTGAPVAFRAIDVRRLDHIKDLYWLGCAAFAVALSISATLQLDVEQPTMKFWWLYVSSLIVFAAAAIVAERRRIRLSTIQARSSLQRVGRNSVWWTHIIPVAAILATAAILRTYQLETLPFGTWYDEAANGLEALRMQREPAFRPVYTAGVNAAGHYLFLVLGALQVFGTTTFAIRIVSAVMGVLTVAAGYLFGRQIAGHRFGLLLALLFAFSRWAINFSRLGMYNISTPLFQLLAFGLLIRASRRGSVADYGLAGLSIGIGLCFYPAFQLFLPVLAAFFVFVLVRDLRASSGKREPAYIAVQDDGMTKPNTLSRLMAVWHSTARTVLVGMIVTGVGVAIAVAPLAKFALQEPDLYFSRVQKTALFSDKSSEERLPALLENVRKHLLMFNERGDPNGRHNIPGAPMLDPVSAGLMVVGLAYGLIVWRRILFGLLLIWFTAGLLGGILSLDFEAPQSLRSIGAFPAATIAVAIPLYLVWKNAEQESVSPHLRWLARLTVFVIVMVIGVLNVRDYFVVQAHDFASWNAFSTPETITARLLLDQSSDTEAYVISLFSDHPTIRFLTYGQELSYQTLDTTAQLPFVRPADRTITMILDADRKEMFSEAQSVYPNAFFDQIKPPFGGPTVVYFARIDPTVASEVQGLEVRYYSGSEWAGEPAFQTVVKELRYDWPGDAPIEPPFTVEWSGVLALEDYGAYQFFVQAPDTIQLFIDESLIVSTDNATSEPISSGVVLAKGRHRIRIRARSGSGTMLVGWRTPQAGPESIPAWHLYHDPIHAIGLLGTFFPNGQWRDPEAFQEINQRFSLYFHIPRMARPYTVQWTGKLAAPVVGEYTFGMQSIDEASLLLDGQLIVSSVTKNEYAESTVVLEEGLHDIEIRYADRTDHTYINVYWQPPNSPPGTPRQVIPPELLFPPQATYELIDLPSLDSLTIDESTGSAVSVPPAVDPASVDVVASGLDEPRAIVVTTDRIFVAETGASRVSVLDRRGETIARITHPSQGFVEPFALDIANGDQLVVLDSAIGRVSLFGLGGEHIADLSVPKELSARARGLHVDAEGAIWLANTPGGRVVAFDLAGNIVTEIEHTAGGSDWQGGQPVDVVHSTTGDIFVVDSGYNRLVRYDAHGRRLLGMNIAAANTMDGAHIAVDGNGRLYLTDPEGGLVLFLAESGERQAIWSVRTPSASDAKPVGIDVDADGAVWIADPVGGRILKLTPSDVTTLP